MRFLLSVEISFSFEFRFVYIKFGKKVDKISPKIDKMGLSDDMLYR